MEGKILINNIEEYYIGYDEENRLIKDKVHQVEYDTTIYFLNKYISLHSKILDIGAGTGRYSFYYANKGATLFSMDIIDKHVEIMKQKMVSTQGLNIKVEQGDALDLSRFNEGDFDTVLCMGPLYHLSEREEQIKRVLKSRGIMVVSYINIETLEKSGGNSFFIGLEPDKVEVILYESGFKVREHIATDGVSPRIGRFIKQLDENDYSNWIDFHLSICKTRASINNTLHALVIVEKA